MTSGGNSPADKPADQGFHGRPNTYHSRNDYHAAHETDSSSPSHSSSTTSSTSSHDGNHSTWASTKRQRASNMIRNFPSKTTAGLPNFSRLKVDNDHVQATGKVSKQDGRLKISFGDLTNDGLLGKALGARLKHRVGRQAKDDQRQQQDGHGTKDVEARYAQEHELTARRNAPEPKLNIVVMVIGSRGDIQPFIKISKILKEQHGHRVRIATHPAFKDFVEKDCRLEFFSVGGNPSELMAFMVKNPGLIPSLDTVKKGEIGRRRDQMYEMFQGFWRACVMPMHDQEGNPDSDAKPFVADFIIANPPSYAHVHCAEKLGCPLHIVFTFPYSPTTEFPHPLANTKPGHVDPGYTNFISYSLVEMMTWQGLGDLLNRFRVKTLGLDPVSTLWAPGQLYRLKVPYTYLWSPSLVPKPQDWGPEIDIAGFVFLDLASSFKPSDELVKFLDDGEPPVYIGFGSIVVDDPNGFTELIFEAVAKAGVRALISEGWGGLGNHDNTPDNIFMLGNTPHDWLFPRCKAVVHHGGAGTTAMGLKSAKPTMIVPFFGDQPFWGSMVAAKKAGAWECVPYKLLTADKLAEGIKQCLTEEAQRNVQAIADNIAEEGDGADNAVDSVLASLPSMRCSILEEKLAVWRLKGSSVRLSGLAAELLVQGKRLSYDDLRLLRFYDWNDFQGPGAPLTGLLSGINQSVMGIGKGLAEGPISVTKDLETHARYAKARHSRKKKSTSKHPDTQHHREPATSPETQHDRPTEASHLDDHPTNALPPSTQHAGSVAASLPTSPPTKPDPHRTPSTTCTISTTPPTPRAPPTTLTTALAHDLARGLTAPLSALASAPLPILTSLALGLHNAPRLYGDTTVRVPPRITGLHSGLRAAASSFTLNTWDAVTGLVRQPAIGAREDGVVGAVGGVGKGVAGLVLKGVGAAVEPVAWVGRGVEREVRRGFGRGGAGVVVGERVREGVEAVEGLEGEEREVVWERVRGVWEGLVGAGEKVEDVDDGVDEDNWDYERE